MAMVKSSGKVHAPGLKSSSAEADAVRAQNLQALQSKVVITKHAHKLALDDRARGVYDAMKSGSVSQADVARTLGLSREMVRKVYARGAELAS